MILISIDPSYYCRRVILQRKLFTLQMINLVETKELLNLDEDVI